MPNPITPPLAALETRLGLPVATLEGPDKARAAAAIEDAVVLVLAEAPANVATAWEADAPRAATLVVLKAARREFENPQGYSTESIGDHSVGTSETSGVYLTAREIGQVRRAATGRSGRFVGTVRTPSAYYDPATDG